MGVDVRAADIEPEPSWICSPPDDQGFMTCLIPVTSVKQDQAARQAREALNRVAQSSNNSTEQSPTINITNNNLSSERAESSGLNFAWLAGILLAAAGLLWAVWAQREHIPPLVARLRGAEHAAEEGD